MIVTTFVVTISSGGGLFAAPEISLSKHVNLPIPLREFQPIYDLGVQGQCGALLELVEFSGEDTSSSLRALRGELLDRGVCLPKNPEVAYRVFRDLNRSMGQDWGAVSAFKLWYGDGVARDRDEARRQFKAFAVNLSWREGGDLVSLSENWLADRSPPIFLIKALDWVGASVATSIDRVVFANMLINGTGRFIDGTPYEDYPDVPRALLEGAMDIPEAPFWLGVHILDGNIKSRHGDTLRLTDAERNLTIAARCGYIPAMLKLARHLTKESAGSYQRAVALAWLRVADEAGAKVGTLITKVKSDLHVASRPIADDVYRTLSDVPRDSPPACSH